MCEKWAKLTKKTPERSHGSIVFYCLLLIPIFIISDIKTPATTSEATKPPCSECLNGHLENPRCKNGCTRKWVGTPNSTFNPFTKSQKQYPDFEYSYLVYIIVSLAASLVVCVGLITVLLGSREKVKTKLMKISPVTFHMNKMVVQEV